jgi:hypothetical protein
LKTIESLANMQREKLDEGSQAVIFKSMQKCSVGD